MECKDVTRREYRLVPGSRLKAVRAAALARFLARERIY
jgi:predicted metal-dependent HD superfamily phosphohydrolase